MSRSSIEYWDNLTIECKKYTDDPIGEIKRMADQAQNDRAIGSRAYTVLEQRVPFPGFEKRDRKDIGKDYGVTRERIRQIEHKAYRTLKKKYLQID